MTPSPAPVVTDIVLVGGEAIAFDRAVLATGAGAPAWPKASGLEVDGRGFIRVDRYLRSVTRAHVFAAGDVADFKPRPLPKSGLYGARGAGAR